MFFSNSKKRILILSNINAPKSQAVTFEYSEHILNCRSNQIRINWIYAEVIDFVNRHEMDIKKDGDIETIRNYFAIAELDSLKLKL
tara:strand:+ start:308 stop:565 length:258 start_codon:yes stop_codon:yes gene_type:complete